MFYFYFQVKVIGDNLNTLSFFLTCTYLTLQLQKQCCGSGFVFYGSGSWNFFPIRIQIRINAAKKGNDKILGEIFFSTQKVGILFCFINQETFIWYNFKKGNIMKNLLKKWIFIAQFHFQDPDPDSENGSGSSLAI